MAQLQDATGNPILANVTATGAFTLLNDEALVTLFGQAVAAVQVSALAGTITVIFEGSVDGTTYQSIMGTRKSDGLTAVSTTANGIWTFTLGGLKKFRARVSAVTGGTASVTVIAGQGSGEGAFGATISGTVDTSSDALVSAANSSTTPLGGGATFTGTAVDMLDYSTVRVAVFANVASAAGGFQAQFSTDATNWDFVRSTTVPASTGVYALFNRIARYMRVVYTNGGGAQATFRLQTLLSPNSSEQARHFMSEVPLDSNGAVITQAVVHGKTTGGGGGYVAVKVTPAGALVADFGQAAHDDPVAGNPVRVGAKADTTEPTAVADGDTVDLLADLNGKLVTQPYSVPERSISGVTASMTGTGNTSVITAPGASLRNYITQILVTNGHATVGTYVNIKDGTTTIYSGYARQAGGGFALTFVKPLRLTANTALQAANETTASDVRVSAAGFIAP